MSDAIYRQEPVRMNIEIGSQDTLNQEFDFFQSDEVTPLDLTGYSFESYIFLDNLEKTTIPITVTNINLALGQIYLFCDQLGGLIRGNSTYNWLLRWTDPSLKKRTIFEGSFKII